MQQIKKLLFISLFLIFSQTLFSQDNTNNSNYQGQQKGVSEADLINGMSQYLFNRADRTFKDLYYRRIEKNIEFLGVLFPNTYKKIGNLGLRVFFERKEIFEPEIRKDLYHIYVTGSLIALYVDINSQDTLDKIINNAKKAQESFIKFDDKKLEITPEESGLFVGEEIGLAYAGSEAEYQSIKKAIFSKIIETISTLLDPTKNIEDGIYEKLLFAENSQNNKIDSISLDKNENKAIEIYSKVNHNGDGYTKNILETSSQDLYGKSLLEAIRGNFLIKEKHKKRLIAKLEEIKEFQKHMDKLKVFEEIVINEAEIHKRAGEYREKFDFQIKRIKQELAQKVIDVMNALKSGEVEFQGKFSKFNDFVTFIEDAKKMIEFLENRENINIYQDFLTSIINTVKIELLVSKQLVQELKELNNFLSYNSSQVQADFMKLRRDINQFLNEMRNKRISLDDLKTLISNIKGINLKEPFKDKDKDKYKDKYKKYKEEFIILTAKIPILMAMLEVEIKEILNIEKLKEQLIKSEMLKSKIKTVFNSIEELENAIKNLKKEFNLKKINEIAEKYEKEFEGVKECVADKIKTRSKYQDVKLEIEIENALDYNKDYFEVSDEEDEDKEIYFRKFPNENKSNQISLNEFEKTKKLSNSEIFGVCLFEENSTFEKIKKDITVAFNDSQIKESLVKIGLNIDEITEIIFTKQFSFIDAQNGFLQRIEAHIKELDNFKTKIIKDKDDTKTLEAVDKLATLLAEIYLAESPTDVSRVLEIYIDEENLYKAKRDSIDSTFMIGSYFGFGASYSIKQNRGREFNDVRMDLKSLFVPVGFEASYSSFTMLLAPFDFANPINKYAETGNHDDSVKLKDIFAPSVSLSYMFDEEPIVLGATFQHTKASNEQDQDENLILLFLALDLPLFNLF